MAQGGGGGGGGGGKVQLRWVPSHLGVHGTEQADLLADKGRGVHPNNLQPLSKWRRVGEWEALGLVPMDEESREMTSGDDSRGGSGEDTGDYFVGSGADSEAFSRHVSDRAQERAAQPLVWDTDSSTDVSDSRRRKGRRIIKSALAGGEFYARRGLGLCNAQLCTIMHDYAGCIATKTHRDCKQEGTWDCDPPQTDNTVKSAAAIHAYFGQKITLLSLIFRRWKNFIVRQNIFSSGGTCRCILLDKIVHDKHNNKLHWSRVQQTIMHNYARLRNLAQL